MKALTWCLSMMGVLSGAAGGLGCSDDNGRDVGPSGTAESSTSDVTDPGLSGTDTNDPSGSESSPSGSDDICDEQGFDIDVQPVRLMILQDLSGSMTEVALGSSTTKWQQSKAAMAAVLANPTLSSLEFGYDYFPNIKIDNCARRKEPLLDCGPGNAATIATGLASLKPDGATPLLCAMKSFLDPAYAPQLSSPEASGYLLVVSDGKDNCEKFKCYDDGESPALLEGDFALVTEALREAGIRTFVIGFGNSDIDPDQLNEIAAAGGTSFPTYLAAEDQAELQAAMQQVAESVVSCTYEIGDVSASADPELVNFYYEKSSGKALVPYDEDCAADTGWMWADDEHTIIEFCAAACEELQSGVVTAVNATFGCPSVPVF